MSRLISGLFYGREEAERAVRELKAEGIAEENIVRESGVDVSSPANGIPSRPLPHLQKEQSLEKERRFAGRESGVITRGGDRQRRRACVASAPRAVSVCAASRLVDRQPKRRAAHLGA